MTVVITVLHIQSQYSTCVKHSEGREAFEAHGLANDREGGGDQALAAYECPCCGQHKAGPVDRLWDSLHEAKATDWLQLIMCLHAVKGAHIGPN